MPQRLFVRIVPAIRTIPGVEVFDYALPPGHGLVLGDIVRFPFRRQTCEGMLMSFSETSAYAQKVKEIPAQVPLLRLGPIGVQLLERTAAQTLCSQPTVLNAWLRHVPKRAQGHPMEEPFPSGNGGIHFHYLPHRWHSPTGLLEQARIRAPGRILIITPWRHRAEQLAARLGGMYLHADVADGQAWRALQTFHQSASSILCTTRVGAWLSCLADTVLLDEPEHDDHKQDELSPRYDARWLAYHAALLRPGLALHIFSTTPRLQREDPSPETIPELPVHFTLDPWVRGQSSAIQPISASSFLAMKSAAEEGRAVRIIHATEGLQGRIACRDCGWSAVCDACGFSLSRDARGAYCRRCGKRGEMPDTCPHCGGLDLSRGRMGREALHKACSTHFPGADIQVCSSLEADAAIPPQATVIITDVQGLKGATEDIRHKERMAIHLRRLAADCLAQEAQLILQGPMDAVEESAFWLTSAGLERRWRAEREERHLFSYPPMAKLVKALIDANLAQAEAFTQELQRRLPAWTIRGPMPISYRAKQRQERHVLHLLPPSSLTDTAIQHALRPFAEQAYFDLDPVSFFC